LSSIHNKLANCYAVAGLSQNSYDFAWNHYTKAINYLPDKYKLESAVVAINQARISLYHFLSFNTVNIEKAMTHTIHRLEQLTDNWHKGFYLLSVYQLIHHYIERYPDNKEKWINQANQLLEQFRLIANSIHHPQLMAYAHGYYGRNLINTLYAIQSTQKAIFISADNHLPELQYFFQWQLARLQHKAGHIDLAIQAYEQAIKTLIPVQHQFFSAGRFKNKIFVNAIQPMFMELVHLKSKRTDSDEKLFQMLSLVEQLKIAELTNFFKDECIKEKKGSDKLQSYVKRLTDCVIVYPILSDPPIMIVLQESGPKQIALHIDLNQLKTNARHFYQRLIQGNKESRIHYLGNKLYSALIHPLAPYLNNIQTIVFVPDGILRMIPFAAIYDLKKHRYLCQDYSVVTLPALTLTQKTSRFQPPRILLGGMSLKKHGFSKLPNVSHELATIHQIMGGTILKDQLFTLSHVKNELANNSFNILHFCTHGTFGNDPDSIQLNTFSKPINLNHLANLVALCNYRNQPIELMTLSACNTASGDERSALGLGGMAVKTGVASAIASLWKVEDLAASTMMKTFYQAFHDRKGNKAQCLQNAQKEMIQSDQFSHPSFWAPFIFIGDWH
jgi:CHAT domain-containing protein